MLGYCEITIGLFFCARAHNLACPHETIRNRLHNHRPISQPHLSQQLRKRNREISINTLNNLTAWDNGSEDNYWKTYQGMDANGDGIGDSLHSVDTNDQDRYPLMNPLDLYAEPQSQIPAS